MLRLTLLGTPGLHRGTDRVVGAAVQRHRLALLALLGIAAPRGLTRDRLVGLLWPECDTDTARHRLNVAVHALRKSVGAGVLLSQGDDLRLDPTLILSDVSCFEEALGRGDRESAVDAYAGPFLDGFFLSRAPEFERWSEAERARLADRYAGTLDALASAAASRGDAAAAIPWWRRLAEHDPYNARAALGLMRALAASGDAAAALRHAHAYEVLLQKELGAPAAPELVALGNRLRAASVGSSPARPAESTRPPASTLAHGDDGSLRPERAAPDAIPSAWAGVSGQTTPALSPRLGRHIGPQVLLAGVCGGLAVLGLAALPATGRRHVHPTQTTRNAAVGAPPPVGARGRSPAVLSGAPDHGRHSPDPAAYDLYRRGRHYWSQDTPDEIRHGLDYFRRALDVDPTYAAAYAGLADSYARLDDMSAVSQAEARPRAAAAARRALALDSTVAEAHAALGHILTHQWRWADAERELRLALALDPSSANARLWYSTYLMATGRAQEAVEEARRARALDPLSVNVNWMAGANLGNLGRHEEALAAFTSALDLAPGHRGILYRIAVQHVEMGRYAEGIAELERLGARGYVARARALSGESAAARAILRDLEDEGLEAGAPPTEHERRRWEMALAYLALGDHDRALYWLEQEIATGSNMSLAVAASRRLDPLRSDPRFTPLLQRLGLVP